MHTTGIQLKIFLSLPQPSWSMNCGWNVKQGLIGIQNGCIVVRGDLENIRLQLAGLVS